MWIRTTTACAGILGSLICSRGCMSRINGPLFEIVERFGKEEEMRSARRVAFLVLAFAIAASACGDKLLHLSRIHRFHALAGNGSVVIFARPNSLLENAASFQLEKAFKNEGLRLRLVSTDHEFAEAIQSGKVDVVILDTADKDAVRRLTPATSPLVVPVIAKGDVKAEADAKHFAAVIKSPAKSGKFVDAVDHAVETQSPQQEPKPRLR